MLTAKRRGGAVDGSEDTELPKPQDGVKLKSNIVTDPSRTTVVDNDRIASHFLLKYAEGAPWTVEWFRFIRGINDPHQFFDYEVDDPTQQIEKVNNLPLLVLSAIDPQQDSSSKAFELRGEASTPLSFPVNENDFFIADIGQNRKGLFYVTETYRHSSDLEGVYRINYTMVSLYEDRHKAAVERATVRELFYAADRVGLGYTPLLTPTEWNRWKGIDELVKEIENGYTSMFYNHYARTITIPGQDHVLYDPFLIRFVRALGFSKYPNEIRSYSLDPIKDAEMFTFWRNITEQTTRYERRTIKEMEVYTSRSFRRTERHNTIYYSTIQQCIMSKDKINNASAGISVWKPTKDHPVEIYEGERKELNTLPYFNPIQFKPYILSEDFYNGSYNCVLEYCLRMYLTKTPLDQEVILDAANRLYNLKDIELVYYMPLVYMLLKYSRGLQ